MGKKQTFSGWEGEGWYGEGTDGVKQMKENPLASIC